MDSLASCSGIIKELVLKIEPKAESDVEGTETDNEITFPFKKSGDECEQDPLLLTDIKKEVIKQEIEEKTGEEERKASSPSSLYLEGLKNVCASGFLCLNCNEYQIVGKNNIKNHLKFFCDKCYEKLRLQLFLNWIKIKCKRLEPCLVCIDCFYNNLNLSKHNCVCKNLKTCDICNLILDKKSDVVKHVKECTRILNVSLKKKKLICNYCCKEFEIGKNTVDYSKTHTVERLYKCKNCRKTLVSSEHTLKKRKRIRLNDKSFKCKYCNKTFKDSKGLKDHEQIGGKPYQCKCCNKLFGQISHLKRHKVVHTGIAGFKCDQCNKKFRYSNGLKEHKRSHSGVRPYECEVCKKTFTRSNNFARHKRLHSGENHYKCKNYKCKHYECKYCKKKFAQSGDLTRHERVHTGLRPYNCDFCEKTYTQSSSLIRHKRLHTGHKPFKCERCEKTFSHPNSLKTHKCVCLKKDYK